MKFSIIVPAYNMEKHIGSCLASLVSQQPGVYEKEVILVDDCSTDFTYQLMSAFVDNNKEWAKVLKNKENIGLGLTRNIGIENASGEWLLFLDSDDALSNNALKELSEYINSKNNSVDIVGYNWEYNLSSNVKTEKYGGRWDIRSLLKNKDELIKEYISLGMDSSVIYSAMKKEMLDAHKLRFRDGLHEDVDFLFMAYFNANKSGALDLPLYFKNNREGSIVNSISANHIKSFFGALKNIYIFLNEKEAFNEELMRYYHRGVLRLLATEVRYIWQGQGTRDWADGLYFLLYSEYISLLQYCKLPSSYIRPTNEPKYIMIASYYLNLMANKPKSICKDIEKYLEDIKDKSWSCYDLHRSVFLTPDEIRTCCKRFFIDNKMKGDVVLIDKNKDDKDAFTPAKILSEKKSLHVRINTGMADECVGCPYLFFKKWEPLNKLKIEYISLEYSTVCNMRCSYCSEIFFGGKKAIYNVESLLKQLFSQGSLQGCKTFMWGGGEPTLDKLFNKLITFMSLKFPDIKQRVFTNATIFSDVICKLLTEDKIISITSIDAGNEETFYKIRKHKGFKDVLNNLKAYSLSNARNMIIKYIITEQNGSLEELRSFAHCVREYSLEHCNFQISYDFKKESVGLNSLISAVALYTYLSDINVNYVFYDDLFWQRISEKISSSYNDITGKLQELDLLRSLAINKRYKSVVVWGAGIQAKFLLEKSMFFKGVKIECFVDNSVEKIGSEFYGHKIVSPDALLA